MSGLLQDLRYAFRTLAKSPTFSAVVVVTLALGIGLNTAIFTVVNAVMLRPLPVERPDELVQLKTQSQNGDETPSLAYPDYEYYRDHNQSFAGLIVSGSVGTSWRSGGLSDERLQGAIVSGNYFDVLGVRADLGRTFLPEEDQTLGTHPVVIVDHFFWKNRLNSDPNVVGRELLLNGSGFTVIGVAPEGFSGLTVGFRPAFWAPVKMQPVLRPGEEHLTRHHWLQVYGRIKSGASEQQARSELQTLYAQLRQVNPSKTEVRQVDFDSAAGLPAPMRGQAWGVFAMLMVVVGLVLLIACANVANLFLERAAGRHREIAIRQAVGAGRLRIVRQLFIEGVVLSVFAGALGVLLGVWVAGLANLIGPIVGEALFLRLTPDATILTFTAGLSIVTAILFGLFPAIRATRPAVIRALQDGSQMAGHRGGRSVNLLVVGQVALSLVVLVAAGLFIRSLQNATKIQLGFNPENVVRLAFDLNMHGYDQDRGRVFSRNLLERVKALPNVRAASLAHDLPLDFSSSGMRLLPEGVEPPPAGESGTAGVGYRVEYADVAPDYFNTLGISLITGRAIEETDAEGTPKVVVVNETLARLCWPAENPLGKRLTPSGDSGQAFEVVGVVSDSKYGSFSEDSMPFAYFSLFQLFRPDLKLIVRTAASPDSIMTSLREAVLEQDRAVAVFGLETMNSQIGRTFFLPKAGAVLLGAFGLLALLLAAVGLYGVVAYSVGRRTREMGLRMAIGASRSDVMRMVLGQGLRLVVVGLAIGLALAAATTRLLSSMLFATSPTDPITFSLVSVVLVIVALLACYIPARRATKIDPMTALRYE